jgi:hypothetical protein
MVPMHLDDQLVINCVSCFGCRRQGFPQSYLGLPVSNCKLRPCSFMPFINKTDKHLVGSQTHFLTPMGRLVLLNSVMDDQFNYIMGAVKLLCATIAKIDKKRRGFLWAGSAQASGAKCLVPLLTVCSQRHEGSMGVKNNEAQNTCLLLKMMHRLYTSTTSSRATWVRGLTCTANIMSLSRDITGAVSGRCSPSNGPSQSVWWEMAATLPSGLMSRMAARFLPFYPTITVVDLLDGVWLLL